MIFDILQKQKEVEEAEQMWKSEKYSLKAIKTIVVLEVEEFDAGEVSERKAKKPKEPLLQHLKNAGYACIPATGRCGEHTDRLYAVINMSPEWAKFHCCEYNEMPFLYAKLLNDGTILTEYWEKENAQQPFNKWRNVYVLKDESEALIEQSDMDNCLTLSGSLFQCQIPFEAIDEVNRLIIHNVNAMNAYRRRKGGAESSLESMVHTASGCGMVPYMYRRALTRGFYKE